MENSEDECIQSFILDDLNAPAKAIKKKHGLENSTMGLKFPIWFAACEYVDFKHQLSSPGMPGKNTAYVHMPSLSLMDSPAMKGHPVLGKLADHLVKYLQNFHSDELKIPVLHITLLCLVGVLFLTCMCPRLLQKLEK